MIGKEVDLTFEEFSHSNSIFSVKIISIEEECVTIEVGEKKEIYRKTCEIATCEEAVQPEGRVNSIKRKKNQPDYDIF